MAQKHKKIIKGYKWHSAGGAKACKQCAALHVQEFYHDPKPGQKSVDEMPKPPLHPNCRCTVIEIIDFEDFV